MRFILLRLLNHQVPNAQALKWALQTCHTAQDLAKGLCDSLANHDPGQAWDPARRGLCNRSMNGFVIVSFKSGAEANVSVPQYGRCSVVQVGLWKNPLCHACELLALIFDTSP